MSDVERIVRAALAVVDKGTPLSVGEPLVQRCIEAGRAAQGAAPLSNTFDNSGVSVKSIDQLAAPRAEGLDVPTLRKAMAAAFTKPYEYSDGHLAPVLHDDAAERVAAEYDRLRGASPLNASGDERP